MNKFLFYSKFIIFLCICRALLCSPSGGQIVLYNIWYRHTLQVAAQPAHRTATCRVWRYQMYNAIWPPDGEHNRARNMQRNIICSLSCSIAKIILRCTVSKTSKRLYYIWKTSTERGNKGYIVTGNGTILKNGTLNFRLNSNNSDGTQSSFCVCVRECANVCMCMCVN